MRSDSIHHPDLKDLLDYGYSGAFYRNYETELGMLRIVHGTMGTSGSAPRANTTSLQIEGLPEVFLPGLTYEFEDPERLYWESLIKLGGTTAIANVVMMARQDGFKRGGEAARFAMRRALGISEY